MELQKEWNEYVQGSKKAFLKKYNAPSKHVDDSWNDLPRKYKVLFAHELDKVGKLVKEKPQYSKGGKIKNQYEGKEHHSVWNEWTPEQRRHFLIDHAEDIFEVSVNSKDWSLENQKLIQDWDKLTFLKLRNAAKGYANKIENSLETHVSMGQYAKGGEVVEMDYLNGEEEGVDLFEEYETLPPRVVKVLRKYANLDETYENCGKMLAEMNALGYTFDYGLSAEPYNLRLIGGKPKYAQGGKITISKNKRLVHGNEVVKGADKNEDYSRRRSGVDVKNGYRLPHGYEVANRKYEGGATIHKCGFTQSEVEFICDAVNSHGSGQHPKINKDNYGGLTSKYLRSVLNKNDLLKNLNSEGSRERNSILHKLK